MNKIYVGNLSYDITNDDLTDFFSSYGPIRDIKLIRDRDTGKLKGFGFIEFEDKNAAQTAVETANGKELLGRNLKVSMAKQKERN